MSALLRSVGKRTTTKKYTFVPRLAADPTSHNAKSKNVTPSSRSTQKKALLSESFGLAGILQQQQQQQQQTTTATTIKAANDFLAESLAISSDLQGVLKSKEVLLQLSGSNIADSTEIFNNLKQPPKLDSKDLFHEKIEPKKKVSSLMQLSSRFTEDRHKSTAFRFNSSSRQQQPPISSNESSMRPPPTLNYMTATTTRVQGFHQHPPSLKYSAGILIHLKSLKSLALESEEYFGLTNLLEFFAMVGGGSNLRRLDLTKIAISPKMFVKTAFRIPELFANLTDLHFANLSLSPNSTAIIQIAEAVLHILTRGHIKTVSFVNSAFSSYLMQVILAHIGVADTRQASSLIDKGKASSHASNLHG